MAPMIDMVFLLLVFFVWTSSFETPEFDLPSSLAEVPAGGSELNEQDTETPVEAFDEIVVKLFVREFATVIELNGKQMMDVDTVRQTLTEIISLGVQPPVIIDPDDQVTMDNAIQVYDAARTAGADRVLFAARAEG